MNSLTQLLFVAAFAVCAGVLIWRTTDPDTRYFRARLSKQEMQDSQYREQWAIKELVDLAKAAHLSKLPSFGIANSGAHYLPSRHRICLSRAFLSRLSETDLRLILAHEVGHASRRWQTFLRHGAIKEEIIADRTALQITGSTPDQWVQAFQASVLAEPSMATTTQLAIRASALGVQCDQIEQRKGHDR